ncbi:PEP-CTERM sorting domain-containing protein [Tautonia rosea]|uniref:PEP-CTERM sorting domain-containing protein n=1 Tax=Tautonia rosea TaxID=2728037 RepID=UPI001474BFE9|nr:PEP-CTERM sorting domain-containing protein [Tautonia rosea]
MNIMILLKPGCCHLASLVLAALLLCPPGSARGGSIVVVTEIIDFSGADVVQARGINDAGQIVGYRTVAGVTEGFVRTGGGYEFFQVGGANTFALGISNSGTVVGGVATPLPGNDSFVRTAGGDVTTFQPLGDTNSGAIGLNDSGFVVASGNAFGTGGYLRRPDGTVTPVDSPSSPERVVLKTNLTDITNSGTLIGHAIGQEGPEFFGRGWISSDGGATFTDLVMPGEQFTYAWGGNDRGLVVGDFSTGFTGNRTGFVFNTLSGRFTTFSVSGADWTVPTGINDDGRVVGFWRSESDGQVRGFVAQVIPEPSSIALAGIGLAGGGVIALRRRRGGATQPR